MWVKSFFVIKPKWKLFWRIIDTLLQILRKDFTKTRSQTNLVWFRIVRAWWLELLDILRVLWNQTQFGSNLYGKYSLVLYEKCWQHLEHYELWEIKRKIYLKERSILKLNKKINILEGVADPSKVNKISSLTVVGKWGPYPPPFLDQPPPLF